MSESVTILKKIQVPKVRIDEIMLFAFTTPSEPTCSVRISEREKIVFNYFPGDLIEKLRALGDGFEREAEKHLRPVMAGKVHMIRPTANHKDDLWKLLEEWNQKYSIFADEVFARRAETEAAVTEFYAKHNITRRYPALDVDELRARFRVGHLEIPVSLKGGLKSEMFTPEEIRRASETIRESITKAYSESMNGELEEFFSSIKRLMSSMKKGRMVTKASMAKLHRVYGEALEGLSVTQDEKYEDTFVVMGNVLKELARNRERHSNATARDDRDMAANIVAETLNATKSITAEAKPVLEEFETILTASKRPAEKRKAEGLREVLDSLSPAAEKEED